MRNNLPLVIADADALIALISPDDLHHHKVREISQYLDKEHIAILFPITAIFEAVTAIQRKLSKPELASALIEKVKAGVLPISYIDETALTETVSRFNPFGSKQNTLYDALVATLARKHHATAIFSFDGWYKKQGFTLAEELLPEKTKVA